MTQQTSPLPQLLPFGPLFRSTCTLISQPASQSITQRQLPTQLANISNTVTQLLSTTCLHRTLLSLTLHTFTLLRMSPFPLALLVNLRKPSNISFTLKL